MLAFFSDEEGRKRVKQFLNEAASDKHNLFMTVINAGEVYYMAARKDGADKALMAWNALPQFPIQFIGSNLEFVHTAATVKATHKLSYTDAFAGALTIAKKGTLITGDHEFDNLSDLPGFTVENL